MYLRRCRTPNPRPSKATRPTRIVATEAVITVPELVNIVASAVVASEILYIA